MLSDSEGVFASADCFKSGLCQSEASRRRRRDGGAGMRDAMSEGRSKSVFIVPSFALIASQIKETAAMVPTSSFRFSKVRAWAARHSSLSFTPSSLQADSVA